MRVFRRPDGNITEKRTEKPEKESPSPDQGKESPASSEGQEGAGPGPFDSATRRMERGQSSRRGRGRGEDAAGGWTGAAA